MIVLGEKLVPLEYYDPSPPFALSGGGDAHLLYTGLTNTHARTTAFPPTHDATVFSQAFGFPNPGVPANFINYFGSAHPSGFNVALADGSVRHVRYSVDLASFRPFGDIHGTEVCNLD